MNGLRVVKTLAFLQRALGLHPRGQPFQDLSRRSLRALERLGGPPEGLRFRVALQQLRSDWDLLTDEATLNRDGLGLRLRVLELATTIDEADRLIRSNFEWAPVWRLFTTLVAQADQNATSEIEIRFDSKAIQVAYDGKQAMTIPAELGPPLRGVLRFVEAAGFARVRHLAPQVTNLPNDLHFAWSGPDRLTLTLV